MGGISHGGLCVNIARGEIEMPPRCSTLTRREEQFVSLLAHGFTNEEIAHIMSIPKGTADDYLSCVVRKLNAKDRFDLVLYGLKHQTSLTPAI
jgi:DNA-binding NarL/FixJ family response regulator